MKQRLRRVIEQANQILLGKERALRLALSCLLARGHLLIEDLPGVGKTTLAHLLAHLLGLQYQRIQFTSDLLPADILGVSIFDRERSVFRFHPGPIFSQLILADEINRATPKTQSALLEAMEEQQVTVDGETRALPEAFFVIATQNPLHQVGTFALPESQLDRFLMRIYLGYPDAAAERELLGGKDRRALVTAFEPVLDVASLRVIQREVEEVHAAPILIGYVQSLLEFSRRTAEFEHGLSPRAGIALLRSAKAWALLHGHDQVLPEDVQAVLGPVVGHRLRPLAGGEGGSAYLPAESLLRGVPVPA